MKKRVEFDENEYGGHLWKDVMGYEGFYKISNCGAIRSIPRLIKRGHRIYFSKDYVLSPSNSKGYKLICLQREGIKIMKSVHILVAECFVDNIDNKPFVNHKNGNKSDNRSENLEWSTHQENIQHAFDTGLYVPLKGSQKVNAKFNEDDIVNIREMFYEGEMKKKELAIQYGVTPQCINQIVKRVSWHHV